MTSMCCPCAVLSMNIQTFRGLFCVHGHSLVDAHFLRVDGCPLVSTYVDAHPVLVNLCPFTFMDAYLVFILSPFVSLGIHERPCSILCDHGCLWASAGVHTVSTCIHLCLWTFIGVHWGP